jgi:hypothetical protein
MLEKLDYVHLLKLNLHWRQEEQPPLLYGLSELGGALMVTVDSGDGLVEHWTLDGLKSDTRDAVLAWTGGFGAMRHGCVGYVLTFVPGTGPAWGGFVEWQTLRRDSNFMMDHSVPLRHAARCSHMGTLSSCSPAGTMG